MFYHVKDSYLHRLHRLTHKETHYHCGHCHGLDFVFYFVVLSMCHVLLFTSSLCPFPPFFPVTPLSH